MSKTCIVSSVFGSFVLKICVSPGFEKGGVSPGRAGSAPQYHQDLGGAKCSDTLRNC